MSGGHFNYQGQQTKEAFEGQWCDAELNALFYDLFCAPLWGRRSGGLATALDFWLAGDIEEETYREYVQEFKDKWLQRTPKDRVEFYKGELQKRCDELKRELWLDESVEEV